MHPSQPSSEPARRRLRPAARPTPRQKYRRIALDLAHAPTSHGLPEAPFVAARVSFNDVADALAITRPALYRLWPSQYDFWVDLTRYIAFEVNHSAPGRSSWHERPPDVAPTPPNLPADLVDSEIASRANRSQQVAFDDIRVVIRAAKLGYPAVDDLGQIRQQVEADRLAGFASFLEGSFAVIGRAADANTRFEVAACLWCIAEGLSLLHRLDPEPYDRRFRVDFGNGANDWSLLALATRALYLGFTVASEHTVDAPPPTTPAPAAVGRPSWTPAQTEVLETAATLFVGSVASPDPALDSSDVLGYVTVARVAALAGVTRRSIYNVWATREAMMSDLLADLLAEKRRAARAVLEDDLDIGATTDRLIGLPGVHAPVDPWLAFLLDLGNAAHRTTIVESAHDLARDLTDRLAGQLRSMDRSPRSGVAVADLGRLWLALVQGGQRLRRSMPDSDVRFARTFTTIIDELTVRN